MSITVVGCLFCDMVLVIMAGQVVAHTVVPLCGSGGHGQRATEGRVRSQDPGPPSAVCGVLHHVVRAGRLPTVDWIS